MQPPEVCIAVTHTQKGDGHLSLAFLQLLFVSPANLSNYLDTGVAINLVWLLHTWHEKEKKPGVQIPRARTLHPLGAH